MVENAARHAYVALSSGLEEQLCLSVGQLEGISRLSYGTQMEAGGSLEYCMT